MATKPRPLLPPPKRSRSLSTTSSSPAPLSPAYRLAEQYLQVTDDMDSFSFNRDQRVSALKRVQTEAQRLAPQLLVLRQDVAARPNDLGLRLKLLEVEASWKRALEREDMANKALHSPSIIGPPSPRSQNLDSPIRNPPLIPPCPPRTFSPTSKPRPLSTSFSSTTPRPSSPSLRSPPQPRPSSPQGSPRISISSSASPALRSLSPRLSLIIDPLPPSTPIPRSDPLPTAGHSIPSHSVLITSHLSIPNYAITSELGLVQAVSPSITDVGGLKERLRFEGERRGAHAVVGVATRVWEGEGGGLVGVGRAIKLKKV
ncbi:hypothetical protein JCM11641_003128 [Rhodosporidiobolus odoratus]